MENTRKTRRHMIFIMVFICFFVLNYGDPKEEAKYFKDGQEISETEFIKNGKNGIKVLYESGVKTCEIEYKNGKENGRWIEWDESGKRKNETNYLEGLKHGKYLEWHHNGQKRSEGKYLNDKKNERWLEWDEEGNLILEESWENGRLILHKDLVFFTTKSIIYYHDGKKRYEREFKGKEKHGKWIKWNSKGIKMYERGYKEGMKHGRWIEWDTNGNITTEEMWEKGEIVKKIK